MCQEPLPTYSSDTTRPNLAEEIVRRLRDASSSVTVDLYKGAALMITTGAAETIVRECLQRFVADGPCVFCRCYDGHQVGCPRRQ